MTSLQPYKRKLIEVAIPLEAINAASKREKSIRHGHPSTLHLWWARRPLAAARAVLFAQLVDDPEEYIDELLKNETTRYRAQEKLDSLREACENQNREDPDNAIPLPTLKEVAVGLERRRLFRIIESLVNWENSTRDEVLELARAEIARSCRGNVPVIYDPFSGGGSIPLEAQRLGLTSYGSDLNPVAVAIGKAMIEIPGNFVNEKPVNPKRNKLRSYRNAQGLAEDIDYYGDLILRMARERVGDLYPQANDLKLRGGVRPQSSPGYGLVLYQAQTPHSRT